MGAVHAWGQLARLEHPWIPFKNGNPMGLGQCSNANPAEELRGNAKVLPTLLPQPTFILAWNARNNSLLRKYGGQFIKNSFPLPWWLRWLCFSFLFPGRGAGSPNSAEWKINEWKNCWRISNVCAEVTRLQLLLRVSKAWDCSCAWLTLEALKNSF